MLKQWKLWASISVMLLASAASYAQSQSQTAFENPDRETLPNKLRARSTRRAAVVAPNIFNQLANNNPTSVFDASAERFASFRPRIVRVQTVGGQNWAQFAQNPQHTGFLNVVGQNPDRILADIIYDANVPAELANNDGALLVHYQTPLVDGDDVFMESKDGTYTTNNYSTQRWHQNRFTWQGGQLVKVWTFDSDWVAPGSQNDFWEPVYHAALANGFVYDQGAAGTIFKLNRTNGGVVTRINPFSDFNRNRFVISPLTVDGSGNLYYTVVETRPGGPSFYSNDVVDSWLVRVAPDDTVTKTSFFTLLAQAQIKGDPVPSGTSPCKLEFPSSQLPWPPSPDAQPSTFPCGSQRAAVNVGPAVAPDGTIYVVSRAHVASRYNYLIAVNPNLTGRWAASLRNRLNDGCNDGTNSSTSVLPLNGTPGGCRVGAHPGVDPGTNEPPPGRVLDDGSSSPTVAPDGTILFGVYTRYNWAQGHLMQFSANGDFLKAFNFGWDITPGIWQHGSTYSIVIKENRYGGVGSYCNVEAVCPSDRTATYPNNPESYFVTQLNHNLNVEWRFHNTNTLSCQRQPDGSITCVDDHPNGHEWCINALAIDFNGTVYGNSEDGFFYALNQGGTVKAKIFMQQTQGAAYTPASLGADGKIYAQNTGHLFVFGNNPPIASNGWGFFKTGVAGK